MSEPWREFNVDELFACLADDGIQETPEHAKPKHAYNDIGLQYMKLNQHDKAMAWFRQAADLHSSPGNFNIGKAYQLGTGVPKDPYTAFDWLIKAAKQKNQDAYVEIGNMFGSGIGVPVNKYLSLEWLCKSQRQDLINMAQSQIVDLKYVDKNKQVSQLVNETEAIYRAQRDKSTLILKENIAMLTEEMDANKAIIREKDNQIEALKKEIQKLDPNAFHSQQEEYHNLAIEYQQSKHTVELLEKKFWTADQRLASLKEEYQDLYKDGLHIDDQNEWIKDANEAMKRKLKDPDSIVVALQLEKKKRLRAKRNDIKHKDCLESTLGESIKAENKQLELLKQKSKADLNIAKLRNDTLESVNRKLKYKMETRNSVEPESTFTKT